MSRPTSAAGSWVAVFGYMALIFVVSALSFHAPLFRNVQKFHFDWLAHVVEYGVLGFLLARAVRYSASDWGTVKLWLTVLAIGVFYAATDEYHQSFIATRDASVYDGVADTIGLSLGCWIRLKKRKG